MSAMASNLIPNNILNDLCARFIINLPEKESQDVIRVFFQVELAHWFYLDFYWSESLGKACSLKEFASQIFNYCPSLTKFNENFDQAFESWKIYKQSVPTYGAILLDPTLQFCLLLQGYWVKSSWGFPKGKVNQDEPPIECAIREVLEETGYDIRNMMDPSNCLEYQFNEQVCRLYIVHDIPMDTKFQAKTRQEIKAFTWFRVDYLPTHKKDNTCKVHYNMNANAFFMVIPFMKELKLRIQQMQIQMISLLDLPEDLSHPSQKTHPDEASQMTEQYAKKYDDEPKEDFIKKLLESSDKRGGEKSESLPSNDKQKVATNSFSLPTREMEGESQIVCNENHQDPQNVDEEGVDDLACEFKNFDFLSPAWSDFKLNTEELLNSMCSF